MRFPYHSYEKVWFANFLPILKLNSLSSNIEFMSDFSR